MKQISEFILIFSLFFTLYFSAFLVTYKSGLNPQILQSEDFLPTAVLPFSIIKEHNFDLNEYYEILSVNYPNPDNPNYLPYYLKTVGEKVYSFFPTFTSILVTPIYVIPSYLGYDQSIDGIRILSRLGGAFITSLSVAVFWLILKKTKLTPKRRLLLLFIYALGTNSLSTSSQGLWQHGSSQLLNAVGLLMLLYGSYSLGGLAFGFSVISRPTNLLSLVAFAAYTYYKTKNTRILRNYIISALIPISIEIAIDTYLFGSIFNTGYGSHSKWTANIVEGFFGLLISPSKGLFITTPVLIFTLYGIYKTMKSPHRHLLNTFLVGVFFFHTIAMGKWYNWFGGYSWGTRMESDILPYIVFLLIPFIQSKYFERFKAIFVTSAFLGFIYHISGLIFFDGVWHTVFDGKNKMWLWSITNSEPVFTIKRILGQLGFISNPIPSELRAP